MTRSGRSSGLVPGAATVATGMRDIDEAVQNPVFFLSLLGAPLLTAVAA